MIDYILNVFVENYVFFIHNSNSNIISFQYVSLSFFSSFPPFWTCSFSSSLQTVSAVTKAFPFPSLWKFSRSLSCLMTCSLDLMNSPHNILLWTREMAQWVKPWPVKPDKFGSPKSTKVGQSSSSICHHTEPLLGQRKWTLEITRSPQASQLSVCSGEQEVSCLKQGGRWGSTPRVVLWPSNMHRKGCMHTHAHIPKLFYCGMYVCMCVCIHIYTHICIWWYLPF